MHITRLETTDGHLKGVPLAFSPKLNCIIGARGTCKSTIIETIRFAFNEDPARVKELLAKPEGDDGPSHRGLVAATLSGGTATVSIEMPFENGSQVATVERDTSSQPRVYVDGVKAVDEPTILKEIEIYSQGELQEIAISPAKRLALIDRPHKSDLDSWRAEAKTLAEQIAVIGPQLRQLREAIESGKRSIAEAAPLRQELASARSARPELSAAMEDSRRSFQENERQIVQARLIVQEYRSDLEQLKEAVRGVATSAEAAASLASSRNEPLRTLSETFAKTSAAAQQLVEQLPQESSLDAILAAAKAKHDEDSRPYYELLQQEHQATEAIKREDRLRSEVSKIERLETEVSGRQTQLEELDERRLKLRKQLETLRTRVYHRRLTEVERINEAFSDNIILSLNHGTHSERYRTKLDELLYGSRLRDREALCEQIAAALPPAKLISFVEQDDATGLSSILNRDAGQMLRLLSHLGESEELYKLESEVADDELQITMFVDGTPKSVNEMSKGQKATAILPLLLRPADGPLLLDQPEDDLDNRFIFRTLVGKVTALKQHRQLIFVTHNANIPVIGNAERVFVMGMDGPTNATVVNAGNVEETREEIVGLLEGGKEAFELRSETYGYGNK